jgi:starch-binding outer membrane protein, SusD/RagB family
MKQRIAIIFFSIMVLSSCRKELLSPEPQTQILEEVAFSTPEKTLAAVYGVYAGAKVGQIYGGRYFNYQDARGEEFLNESANGVTQLSTWNFTVTPTTNEVTNFWAAAYTAINRANVVLAGIDKSPVSDALKNQYKGEVRFIRALMYHSLVTIFARPYWDGNGSKPGVVIYTEPQTSLGENQKARATVAEVYTQILDDLNFAEANLAATNGSTAANVTRAHKNTAIALKTRVNLFKGDYAAVITEGNKLAPQATAPFSTTSGVSHSLVSNITTVFGAGGQTPENILSFPFTANDLPGTQNSLNQYYSPSATSSSVPFPCTNCGGNGDYSLNLGATGIASNTSWGADDARRQFNQVISNTNTTTRTWLRKWTANTDYSPAIRYAEVLLNLAEALARVNGVDAKAVALLNAVRKRSDPSVTLVPTTQQELIDMILLERRIELLGEGFRSRDLLRLGLPIPAKGTAPGITTASAQYIWPIPQSELIVNKAVTQNPGY